MIVSGEMIEGPQPQQGGTTEQPSVETPAGPSRDQSTEPNVRERREGELQWEGEIVDRVIRSGGDSSAMR